MKTSLLALVLSAGLAATAAAAPVTYAIDPVHSSVTYTAKTLFTPIPGSFLIGEGGTLTFDPADPAACRVEAIIPIASVNTLNTYRDKNITTKDGWFAAEKFPVARFASTRWEKTSAPGGYRISGDLTLNGVTKPVVIAATHLGSGPGLEPGDEVVGFEGRVVLDRTAFGVTADTKIIAAEIPVTLLIQGLRKTAAAK